VRRILAEFQVTSPVTAAAAVVSELRVKLDTGPRPVAEMHDSEELLNVIMGDRSQNDKEEAAEKLFCEGITHVVTGTNASIDKEATLAFWKYGTGNETHWSRDELPVVVLLDLVRSTEEVEVDPFVLATAYRYVTLVNGYNSDSGVDWGKVSMQRRALIVAAGYERSSLLQKDAAEIALLLADGTELQGGWKVLNRRLTEEKRQKYLNGLTHKLDAVKRRQKRLQRSTRQYQRHAPQSQPHDHRGTSDIGRARKKRLEQFLRSAFNPDRLYRIGYQVRGELPGQHHASMDAMLEAFMSAHERRDLFFDDVVWNEMKEQLGFKRHPEIREIALLYGVRV
jgi:hypothetical protein